MNSLYWYGNTSSACIWYSMGYKETVEGVRRGQRVMNIGMGAGFEFNTNVWRALRDIHEPHTAWGHIKGRESEAKEIFTMCCRGEKPYQIERPISKIQRVRLRGKLCQPVSSLLTPMLATVSIHPTGRRHRFPNIIRRWTGAWHSRPQLG